MSAVNELLKMATWKELEQYPAEAVAEGLPYATHEGEMEIMGHKLRCYRLNTGQAVVNADDAHAFFGGLGL